MGTGASVSDNNTKASDTPRKGLDIDAIKEIQEEITKLERASNDTDAIDEFIDTTQTRSSTSSASRATRVNLVTDSIQKTVKDVDGYFDNIVRYLEKMRAKLCEFKEAVIERCEQYSDDANLRKLSRVRQQINVVDEIILKAKERLNDAKQDKTNADMVKSLKRKVQNLELFKSDLRSSGNDSSRSEKFDKALKRDGKEYIIDDILKWREEALKLRREYEELYTDNEEMKTKSKNDITILQENNEKFYTELQELRQEADIADKKVAECEARVQLVEEKLLDERLSHEVEINSLKAMLEKKDDIIAKLMGKGNPTTPDPAHGQVRLSPEGIVGSSDNEPKGKADNSRGPSPEGDKDNENNQENEEESDVARILAHMKTDEQENDQTVMQDNNEVQSEVPEACENLTDNPEKISKTSPDIVPSTEIKESNLPQTKHEDASTEHEKETDDSKPQEVVLFEEGTVKEIVQVKYTVNKH